MNQGTDLCIVDTNVPIVANGQENVSDACLINCIEHIKKIIKKGLIAIDDKYLILNEYIKHLSHRGQPGIGDKFLKWVLTNQRNPQRCKIVSITPLGEAEENFREFPIHPKLADFDPSDRKFVAVSVAHPEHPPILEATDSKWLSWEKTLKQFDINIIFVCPEDIQRFFQRRSNQDS